jgi:shikimate dehydrogenase
MQEAPLSEPDIPHRITGKTKLLFILGDPVAHILGSALFNEHFRRNGIDAVISPLHVLAQDLGIILGAIRRMHNLAGFGVTIPHKIPVIAHLDRTMPRARHVGAVNFVRREADGTLVGDNVDGLGFVAGLTSSGVAVAGRRVLQIGAGGAGRAIAFALAEAGVAELRIANRSAEKARLLAEAVQMAFPGCRCSSGAPEPRDADLIVNTTSVGMRPGDPLPVEIPSLAPPAAVADVIMTPETTPLLAQAAAQGCAIVRGREMLINQLRLATAFLAL